MSLEFKPQHKIIDYFDKDFDNIILTTFEFDAGFIEDTLLPVITGKNALKDAIDRLEVMNILREKTVSIITSGNIKYMRGIIGYDLIPYKGIQHSKIFLLAKKDHVRIIIGSINLTEDAFRKNLEAFCVLDFKEGENLPVTLALDVLKYLKTFSNGRGRFIEQLNDIEKILAHIDITSVWVKGNPTIDFMAYPIPEGLFIIKQLFDKLGRERVQEIKIMTPFFEQGDAKFLQYFTLEAIKHGVRNVGIYFPSSSEAITGKWNLPADKTIIELAKKHSNLFHFYPISKAEHSSNRYLHAKLIFINTDKANYLLVGSSNFTKKGLGFENANPNAEANLLFRVPNPNEKKLRGFFPRNVEEQEIEFLDPTPPDEIDEGTEDNFFVTQIVNDAEYRDGKLIIEFTQECADKTWAIYFIGPLQNSHDLIISSDTWDKQNPYKKEIPLTEMAIRSIDLEIEVNGSQYCYPIYFHDIQQILEEKNKSLSISTDSLILFWLDRISRPTATDVLGGNNTKKDISNTLLKPIETPDLLMNRIKIFVKALEGVRAYLDKDKIINKEMLKNRINGVYGVNKIFEIINGIDDIPTRLFCYSEMAMVINHILSEYKDTEQKAVLEEYMKELKNEIEKLKNNGGLLIKKEWEIYLNYTEV